MKTRRAFARGLAMLLAVTIAFPLHVSMGAPADIFTSPAPVLTAEAPKAEAVNAGDLTVSTLTGAVSWSYPIAVPPGRNGMRPTLSLGYSSSVPSYGGIASGFAWNLGAPLIEEDTSQSRLKTHSPFIELTQPDPKSDDRFVGLGGRRLVPVTEPLATGVYRTYRAQGDDGYQVYERLAAGQPFWRVRSLDGSVMEFGGSSAACSNVGEGYAPLTQSSDVFGNAITYTYEEAFPGECRLTSIAWGANANANLMNFAAINFVWNPSPPACNGVPVGTQMSYRSGVKIVTGASQLSAMSVTAFEPGGSGQTFHTRTITLQYSAPHMQCNRQHAPVKLLTSIQETVTGQGLATVSLPPVTLEYSDPAVAFENPGTPAALPWTAMHRIQSNANSLAWGYRYANANTDVIDYTPTVEEMMIDLDGDSLPDRLVNTSNETFDGKCSAVWQRNLGPAPGSTEPRFAARQSITLPHLKWRGQQSSPPVYALSAWGEKCSLAGQVTAFSNSFGPSACHDGTTTPAACRAATDPADPTLYCDPNGRECPNALGHPDTFTYLNYRWVDADGDGLTDLVAAVHGDVRNYDIEQGNSPASSPPPREPALFGPWPSCPRTGDRCKNVDVDCVATAKDNVAAINACVDKAPLIPCHLLIDAPYGAAGTIRRGPYQRCEGLYPWFIFKNTGNGNFASPVIKYQPVPLESDRGDSSLGPAHGWTSQQHAVLDFDGDGILDALVKPPTGNFWWVWFGDGTGGFEPKRYMFSAKYSSQISATDVVPLASVGAVEGLFDLNADGLLDHWTWNSTQNYSDLWFNTGTAHSSLTSMVTPSGIKPGDDAMHEFGPNDVTYIAANPPADPVPKWIYWAGRTKQQNRIYDVDQDGRLDVVSPSPLEGAPTVYFNLGSQFNTPGTALASNPQGLRRLTSVVGTNGIPEGTWLLLSDHIDLDGDGIAEVVDFSGGNYVRARQLNSVPPRQLTKVNNGLGAHTAITYASMHDSTTVAQDPSSFWIDHWNRAHPNASPATQWVVKSMTSTDDYAGTSSTTSYFYKNPRHGADDQGRYAFRGFDEVTTTTPSGATNVERYRFDVDWGGRLAETLVKPSANEMTTADEVRSISRTTWEERSLFSGTLRTQHPTITEQFTCWNGQNEAACKSPAGAAAYTRKTSNLEALTASGAPEASIWVATSSLLQAGVAAADGDRETRTSFAFVSQPGLYRLRPLVTEQTARSGSTMQLFNKTATTWDPEYRVKLTEEVSFDANRSAVTHYDYDFTTGNVIKRWKPKQYAANKAMTYAYDTRQMFITTEVNELGHRIDNTYDYGTGTKLLIEGPNQRTCATGATCPLDANHPLKEQSKVVIDAAGRTIETWATVSDDGALYTLVQTSSTAYADAPVPGMARTVTRRAHLDASSSVWTREVTELDGLGRPLTKTVDAQGSAPADHVTVFTYRNDGTVATVQVPDPAQNTAARVTYSYFFDSLGRPTMLRRPDGSDPLSNQSGVNIQYNGTTVTTSTVAPPGTGEGQILSSVTTADAFGRVTQTEEIDASIPSHPTTYVYGPDDNVQQILAPDGVITTMKHDFAGHRTEITRHGRTWKYGYDDNGNLASVTVPGSPNPPVTDINFTSTIVYDDLDRPIEKLNGPRTLSSANQSLFANRRETFEYDIGGNMTGRLRYWRSFAPNQSTAAIVHSTRFNAQGQLITTMETLRIAGFPTLQRQIEASYQLLGGVSEVRYEDQLGGTNKTSATTAYDARGLPTSMVLKRTGQADQTLAVQTRNVAGLVTKRRTDTTGAMTFVESNWVYDTLGRVAIQTIQKGPGPVQVARETLRYFGDDSPQTISGALGSQTKQLSFTYDARQQLKTVSSSTAGYFGASYNYGAGGRFSRATESQTIGPLPAGTNVRPRDVNYVYGDADPERLTALRNANGSTYAGYKYDAIGNLTRRCTGGTGASTCAGESIDYVYDGRDQLRRATRKLNGAVQGSEEYWYDGAGNRVAVVKRDAAGTKTELVWFLGDVEAHYDGAGAPTHVYSHLSLATPVGRVDRTSNTTTSLELQFHGLGNNTLAAVAENGTVNASFRYAPFGEVIEATSAGGTAAGTPAHKRRFNDKYEDDLTALAYYGVRYYDRTSMTWTQGDPLYRMVPDLAKGSPRRANLYQFSLNNPLRYMDPDGRDSGHWTRGSQNALDFAMSRENKGATYGGGWLEDYGGIIDNAKTPALNCGVMAPGQCEAIAKGEVQYTFAETIAMAYPGASVTLADWPSCKKMDETAVNASDQLFPERERSTKQGMTLKQWESWQDTQKWLASIPHEYDPGHKPGEPTIGSPSGVSYSEPTSWRDDALDIIKWDIAPLFLGELAVVSESRALGRAVDAYNLYSNLSWGADVTQKVWSGGSSSPSDVMLATQSAYLSFMGALHRLDARGLGPSSRPTFKCSR